jgi:hypothetical protein
MPAMAHHAAGPRRSNSLKSYLWCTRAMALAAALALAGGVASDSVGGHFWESHGLIAGIAGSFLVVILSVAIVNEAIERRRRQRWKMLAQYVMLQLVLNARLIWTGVAELAGKMPSGARTASALDGGSRAVRDTSGLTEAVQELLSDPERRSQLHEGLAGQATSSDEMFGRWAAVMLNSNAYAELIDRHVELASYVSWLDGLLASTDADNDDGDQYRASRSHPSVQFEGDVDDDRLASRLVSITQMAEELDRKTLKLAQRTVSFQWWAARLGMTPTAWTPEASSAERVTTQG